MYEPVLFALQVWTSELVGPAVLQRTRRCVIKNRAMHVHIAYADTDDEDMSYAYCFY